VTVPAIDGRGQAGSIDVFGSCTTVVVCTQLRRLAAGASRPAHRRARPGNDTRKLNPPSGQGVGGAAGLERAEAETAASSFIGLHSTPSTPEPAGDTMPGPAKLQPGGWEW